MATSWKSAVNRTMGKSNAVFTNANVTLLAESIQRFNTIAQAAYDSATLRQQVGIVGTITAKFVKATLKEVASNAISTFGPGAFIDGAFGNIAKDGKIGNTSDAWSSENLTGKGFAYTFGSDGGHLKMGEDSGMTRLSENMIKAGIGWGVGLLQDKLTDEAMDAFTSDAERLDAYIEENIDTTNPILGAKRAMKVMPTLNSASPVVRAATAAHQVNHREGTSSLIKEAVHQIDQLSYAIDDLMDMAAKPTVWDATNRGKFRKCREMVEFVAKMYWFKRKYNKTVHFLDALRDDYLAVGLVLQEMELFWRQNLREMEMLVMRAAANDVAIQKSSGGDRIHMFSDLGEHGGTDGVGNMTTGSRNYRTVSVK